MVCTIFVLYMLLMSFERHRVRYECLPGTILIKLCIYYYAPATNYPPYALAHKFPLQFPNVFVCLSFLFLFLFFVFFGVQPVPDIKSHFFIMGSRLWHFKYVDEMNIRDTEACTPYTEYVEDERFHCTRIDDDFFLKIANGSLAPEKEYIRQRFYQ